MSKLQKKSKIRPLIFAVGAGVALSLASIPIANAASNSNFNSSKLSSGYNLAGSHDGSLNKAEDGKCGAGKCGAGKCGAGKCGSSH